MATVRTNSKYVFHPVGMDIYDPAHYAELKDGDTVRVVRKHGCPPPNTMGHAHVNKINADGSEVFVGLVLTNSLTKE